MDALSNPVTKSRYPLEEDVILLRTFEAISREIDRQTNNQTKQVRCTITLQFGSLTSTIATSTSTSALSPSPQKPLMINLSIRNWLTPIRNSSNPFLFKQLLVAYLELNAYLQASQSNLPEDLTADTENIVY